MPFWGVYVKPNEPYTLHHDDDDDAVPKRLRITQATLGDATRNSPARSIVRCSVGDKPAIAICSLSVRELTCCQLELEFEEFHDVIFSVIGPRGVYLAGYLITHAPIAHHHTIEHMKQDEATVETARCKDLDLHEDGLDSNKIENEHCDKSIKGRKHLLRCFRGKNEEGKIFITLDRKMRKHGNEDTSFGTREKCINRHLCSSDENQEKSVVVKTHSVFGRFFKEKWGAIVKKKKRKRNKKRKPSTPKAAASEYRIDPWNEKFGSDSRITKENWSSSDAHERIQTKVKKKNKNKKRICTGDNNFEYRSSACGKTNDDSSGKVKPRMQERKVS